MSESESKVIRKAARTAGALYLSLVPLGIFSFVYVPSRVLVPGATTADASASARLLRLGAASHLLSQVLVVFLVLLLYRLFRSVNGDRALAMLVLALVCVPISFAAEVSTLGAVDLLASAGNEAAASTALDEARIVEFLGMQRSGVLLAQVFWGLWMLPLAALIARSGFLPRWLAAPVLVASAGYLFDSGAYVLLPERVTISQFTAIAELVFPLWLLLRGVGGAGQSSASHSGTM